MLLRRARQGSRVLVLCGVISVFNHGPAGAQSTWSLPAPWTSQDVGGPEVAGSSAFEEGHFSVTAAGTDIWGASDQFHFIHQQISGDVDVSARIDSITMATPGPRLGDDR